MSSGLYSHTTRATGTVLTAAIYNADHQNHITNENPTMMGGYSDNLSQHQLNTDPGGLGTEVLGANLATELEQIRFCLKRIIGEAQWYIAPLIDLASVGGNLVDLIVEDTVTFQGDLTPAQITANQNDYAPTNHADAFRFRLSSDASRNITGLAGGVLGRLIVLENVDSFNIVLTDQDALSAAGNRFNFGGQITLRPGQSWAAQYSATLSRWRPFHSAFLDSILIQTQLDLTNLLLNSAGYAELTEITPPSNPASNKARLYAKDVAGTTRLAYKDSAGTETIVETPIVLAPRSAQGTYTTNASLSTTIPWDDTAPTNAEGAEIVTASITLQSTSSKVSISFSGEAALPTDSLSAIIVGCTLIRDSTPILSEASGASQPNENFRSINIEYLDSPATTSAITYRIRVGPNTGSIRMNGDTTGRKYGGQMAAVLRLIEVVPPT